MGIQERDSNVKAPLIRVLDGFEGFSMEPSVIVLTIQESQIQDSGVTCFIDDATDSPDAPLLLNDCSNLNSRFKWNQSLFLYDFH